MTVLLEVSDLRVTRRTGAIVDGVGYQHPGEALGLAGESGCGKTTTALALMRLLPPTLEQSGTITLRPRRRGADQHRQAHRGRNAAHPLAASLAGLPGSDERARPVQRIDAQIEEAIQLHERVAKASRLRRAGSSSCSRRSV